MSVLAGWVWEQWNRTASEHSVQRCLDQIKEELLNSTDEQFPHLCASTQMFCQIIARVPLRTDLIQAMERELLIGEENAVKTSRLTSLREARRALEQLNQSPQESETRQLREEHDKLRRSIAEVEDDIRKLRGRAQQLGLPISNPSPL